VEEQETAMWDGIRNVRAQNWMRQIQPGDLILAYHTAPQKAVVGIAVAKSQSYPDPNVPTDQKNKWHVIDVGWKEWFKRPVPLKELRASKDLAQMPFVRLPRLSVSPVRPSEWEVVVSSAQ
jgi:predicted RNA-binding protein with PUA-like domain